MVTGAVPVEVSVSGCGDVDPTVTSPKVRLAALKDNCGLATGIPVPFRATTAVGFVEELLSIVSVPVTAPVAGGAKCI
jgi:hypothetical protein